jgi:xylulokinase
MTRPLVLGIDLGLSGIRSAVMSADGAVLAVSSRYAVPTTHAPGRAEQDPRDWLDGLAKSVAEVLAGISPDLIAAIGISALGPAPVLVDQNLQPLAPALLFSLDTRAEEQRCRLRDQLGLSDAQLNHDHAIPKLMWWAEQETDWWPRVDQVMDATGFLVSSLTGTATMDRITVEDYRLDGATSPVRTPEPVEPTAVVGTLTRDWGERLGLAAGTPVLAGIYDSYADTAAAGALEDGQACLVLGSTLIIAVVSTRIPEELDGLLTAPHLGSGRLVGGWTTSGGTALAWARRLLADSESPTELDARAQTLVPGDGGLIFLPYLAGERSPVHDPHATGALVGLTHESTPEQVYRAVLDGVVLSVRDHVERLAHAGIRPGTWSVRGGGAGSPALMQGIADALGAPVHVMEHPSDPVGPCVLALHGLGVDPAVRIVRTYHPDLTTTVRYDRLYDVYVGLYPALRGPMHALRRLTNSDGGNL